MSTRGLVIAICALVACDRSAPSEPAPAPIASQSAYVWQRHWTPGVREAVARPPAGIGLRVLIAEASAAGVTTMAIDAPSLATAGVPIVLVLRIEGSRPVEAVSIDPIAGVADSLRERGVDVVGIEIDHDCATARLAEYARWLEERRPRGYRLSITALPTWASSAALGSVARAVDEIVVQVHAVRAPVIFDANTAWRDLTRFARAVGGVPLRVALPTYSAVVRDVEVSVDPADVGAFVGRLKTAPVDGVGGIVWFRLPVGGDEQTWSRATFARVVGDAARGGAERDRAAPMARVELVARGAQRFDVVVSNESDALVDMPAVRVAGDIGAADMVMGYRESGPGRWDAPRRSLARDERVVVGWIHGKDLSLVD